jgi:uncharacterized protein YyaL (SSP411 family)
MSAEANTLAHASSAYLRSAMHQPIRWYQWGEQAFAAAQRENKPILLDIGAVWCHWCHVMDRESYDSPEVARIINERYIAIKVDRDERPDIDSRYQAAISAITGQGGWPLTAFLTPDGRPFYGGTYFPAEDHLGRPGLKRVLQAVAEAYQQKHGDVLQSAETIMKVISETETFAGHDGEFSQAVLDNVVASALKLFDARHGGFGSAPKFPHPAAMDFLIDRYARTGDAELRNVIVTTLEHMAKGGVYDQLAGGFHRYSTDERWVVPHFEKMSYDNSELLKNYVHAYQVTGTAFFGEVARDIIRWMDEWLSDRERGGFYASQDADYSMKDDGDYFTWSLEEARAVLSEEELQAAATHYDINETGEMHHDPARNVLYLRAGIDEISRRMSLPAERVSQLLDSAKKKMYAARLQRPTPYVDKTVYVNWNALCVSAYLEAAQALGLDEARHFALRSLDRLLSEAWDPRAGLRHVIAYSDPEAPQRQIAGLLDDYAFVAIACLDAYETTADLTYFNFARRIAEAMIERFYDSEGGGFFDAEPSEASFGALTARRKPYQDSPTPAGNPAAAIALLRLHAYTNDAGYRDKAERTIRVFAGLAEHFGIFAGMYAIAGVWYSQPHVQAVLVGSGEGAERLYAAAVAPFAINKAVLRLTENEAVPQNLPPALAQNIPNLPAVKAGKPVAIVCSDFTCRPPIFTADELSRTLQDMLSATSKAA